MRWIVLPLFLLSSTLFAQTEPTPREQAYGSFDALLGTWEIEAFFLDGTKFEQKFEIVRGVQGAVYKCITWQKDDAGHYQLKSEGIRAWDESARAMKFWDFGVDGTITTGSVAFDGENILYIYDYGGEILTDYFGFERDGLYEYIIGVKDGRQWPTLYCNGGVKRVTQ